MVDDCSDDGSQEILKSYSSDKRLKLFLKNENSGSYVHSTNFGAHQAKGDFLLFAQCDDYAEPTQVEALFHGLKTNETADVAFCGSTLIDGGNRILSTDYDHREESFRKQCSRDTVITGAQMIRYLSKACVIPNLSAALIRRDLYVQIGGLSTNFKVVADWDFWLKAATITNFYYVSRCLNSFRQHDNTIRSTVKMQTQILEVFTMMYRFLAVHQMTKYERLIFKTRISVIWLYYFRQAPRLWLGCFFSVLIRACSLDIYSPIYFTFAIIKIIISRRY